MKLYIVRHGETQWNKEGRMQGWKNSNLSEKGVENAKKLGQNLKGISFDYVYCSPLGRAVETANYILGEEKSEIILNDNLREMSFGIWEGMMHDEVEKLYPEEKYNLWNKPELYKSMEGEDFHQVIERAEKFLKDISENKVGENILIISHAILIKAIYAVIKSYHIKEFWNPPFMQDTCLTVVEVEDHKFNIILEGDISHLE